MKTKAKLPIVKKKKKINLEKFVELAKKVRKSFEEEKKYLEERAINNENNSSNRFLPNF